MQTYFEIPPQFDSSAAREPKYGFYLASKDFPLLGFSEERTPGVLIFFPLVFSTEQLAQEFQNTWPFPEYITIMCAEVQKIRTLAEFMKADQIWAGRRGLLSFRIYTSLEELMFHTQRRSWIWH